MWSTVVHLQSDNAWTSLGVVRPTRLKLLYVLEATDTYVGHKCL